MCIHRASRDDLLKIGDLVVLERLNYRVSSIIGKDVVLRRSRLMTKAQFNKGGWRRLVSSNFLVHEKTGKTVTNYELMAMGIPIDQINRLHETLPLLEEK